MTADGPSDPHAAAGFEISEVSDVAAAWPELGPMFRALHDYHVPLTGRTLVADWEGRQRDHLAATAGSPDALVLIARAPEGAVGFVNARIVEDPTLFHERYGFIENVYVVPDQRGRHITSLLVERVDAWLRARSIVELQLSVVAANEHAVEVWRALGFNPLSYRMSRAVE